MMNESERILSAFAEMYFYKELTQSNLLFLPPGKTQDELADLMLNIGDSIIIVQLKTRCFSSNTHKEESERKWLKRVTKNAKNQIKKTLCYLRSDTLLQFDNARGEKISAQSPAAVQSVFIFDNEAIKDYPKIIESKSGNFTAHCFSFEDFKIICNALITPKEIYTYLEQRLQHYATYPYVDLIIFENVHDDLILVKPKSEEGLIGLFLANSFGANNFEHYAQYTESFRFFLRNIPVRLVDSSEENAGSEIVRFLSLLVREEIKLFMERLCQTREDSKVEALHGPRASIRNDEVAIIFVASSKDKKFYSMDTLWERALEKSDIRRLLQIVVYCEDSEDYRIDFCFAIR